MDLELLLTVVPVRAEWSPSQETFGIKVASTLTRPHNRASLPTQLPTCARDSLLSPVSTLPFFLSNRTLEF